MSTSNATTDPTSAKSSNTASTRTTAPITDAPGAGGFAFKRLSPLEEAQRNLEESVEDIRNASLFFLSTAFAGIPLDNPVVQRRLQMVVACMRAASEAKAELEDEQPKEAALIPNIKKSKTVVD